MVPHYDYTKHYVCFRTTGVYPFDRNAIEVIDRTPHINNPISLTERTGLGFIPLYSPACKSSTPRYKAITKPPVTFTSEEIACFIRRYEEEYDITTDECYNLWLKKYERSDESDSSKLSCEMSLESSPSTKTSPPSNLLLREASSQPRSILKKMFHFPKSHPLSTDYEKTSARVLTSSENMKALEEKENEKEKRKLERERKREEKLEMIRK